MKTEPIPTELTLKHNEQEIRITSKGDEDCHGLMQLLFQLCVGAGYHASSVASAMHELGNQLTAMDER